MTFPIKFSLYKNGYLIEERIAEKECDLCCSVDMDSGTGWLDARSLYQTMLVTGCTDASDTFKVCNSYEKWGRMNQEVLKIKAHLQFIDNGFLPRLKLLMGRVVGNK